MGFKSNGKPGHIYHWNLPVLKKMLSKTNEKTKSQKSNNLRFANNFDEMIDIKNIPTWNKNESIEKGFDKKHTIVNNEPLNVFKKSSPSYYAPVKQKKSSYARYFPGNGKPKGFYIIKNNQHKPLYQNLIP